MSGMRQKGRSRARVTRSASNAFSRQLLASAPSNVALSVEIRHLDSTPQLMADVIWAHPSGESRQTSRRIETRSTGGQGLNGVFPKLIQAFETTVQAFYIDMANKFVQ
jgi:hypothetical protein